MQCKLRFELTDGGEVFVETRAIRRADTPLEALPLLADARQHTLLQHQIGIRLGARFGRILKAITEQTRIQRARRHLSGIARVGVARSERVARIARAAHVDRTEPRAAADGIGDQHIESRCRYVARQHWRGRRAGGHPAGVVDVIWSPIERRVEVPEVIDLIDVWDESLALLEKLDAISALANGITRRMSHRPEPSAEAHRHRRSRGQGLATVAQKTVEKRQADGNRRAADRAAQYIAPRERFFDQNAHVRGSLRSSSAVRTGATLTAYKASLVAMAEINSRSRKSSAANSSSKWLSNLRSLRWMGRPAA